MKGAEMPDLENNKRGVLLILVMIVIVVIAIMASAYLYRLVSERISFTGERSVYQAMCLSESAANMALAEMNKRFSGDISSKLFAANVTAAMIKNYAANSYNSVMFLHDFACDNDSCGNDSRTFYPASNNTTGNSAVLSIPFADYLNKGNIPGTSMPLWNTTVKITVTPPLENATYYLSDNGPFYFNYVYSIAALTRIWRGPGADQVPGTSDDIYANETIAYAPHNFTVIANSNFAKYALFTNNHTMANGTAVWFTNNTNFQGPVHTNGNFSFLGNPSANFTGLVTQNDTYANFYNNNRPRKANAVSYPVNCTGSRCTDLPNFQSGFLRSQPKVQLPTIVDQSELKTNATAGYTYSSTGIYLPNDGTSLTGGIYINGNTLSSADNAEIRMSVDSSSNAVYNITQGNTTKVITVNYAANTTSVVNVKGTAGTPAGNYSGVPSGAGSEGILIYSNDVIAAFNGTVRNDTKVTVASEKDVVINDNVTYTDDPIADSNVTNVLGVISWNGNVRIANTTPDNVTIDAIIMAPKGSFTVDDYDKGSYKGVATIVGGVISYYYGAFGQVGGSGYGRNFTYDARALRGLNPPYFPYSNRFTGVLDPMDIFLTRTSWREYKD